MEMEVKLVLLSFYFVCNIIVLQGKNIAVIFKEILCFFFLDNCHCESDIVSKGHLINSMYRSLTANIKQNVFCLPFFISMAINLHTKSDIVI